MMLIIAGFLMCALTAHSEVLDPALHLFPIPPLRVDSLPAPRSVDDVTFLQVIPVKNASPEPIPTPPVNPQWYYCPQSSSASSKKIPTKSSSIPKSGLHPKTLPSTTPMSPETVPTTTSPIKTSTIKTIEKKATEEIPVTLRAAEEQESMDKAETFWPVSRTPGYVFGGIHVPLTFSVSGTYGSGPRLGSGGGIIGSSYASISDGGIFGVYGNYGKSGLAGSSYGSYGTRIFGSNNGPAWSGWGNGKWGHYGKG